MSIRILWIRKRPVENLLDGDVGAGRAGKADLGGRRRESGLRNHEWRDSHRNDSSANYCMG
jgi:hypothetical protein